MSSSNPMRFTLNTRSAGDYKCVNCNCFRNEIQHMFLIHRCFLVKKTEVILSSIQNIFQIILKFRTQLVNSHYVHNPLTDQHEHEAYAAIIETYEIFKAHSSFLYKGLNYWIYHHILFSLLFPPPSNLDVFFFF